MATRSRRSSRGPIIAVLVVAAVVGGYFGVSALWHKAQNAFSSDQCTVGSYDIDPDQASVAATMVGAVTSYRPALPERAAVLVLAAGLQESKLTNLAPGAGDRDSVGVLQQRPSQGWGSPPGNEASLNDVFEATNEFLDKLVQIDGWQQMPLAHAIQSVQISADESAYAPHEGEAQALADALQGHRAKGISCSFSKPTKVAAPSRVASLAQHDLPINAPDVTATGVRVPGAGWQTTAWFVANADRLGIEQVAYAGWRWSRADGWTGDRGASKSAVVATMYRLN
jgi:hypothetical protein